MCIFCWKFLDSRRAIRIKLVFCQISSWVFRICCWSVCLKLVLQPPGLLLNCIQWAKQSISITLSFIPPSLPRWIVPLAAWFWRNKENLLCMGVWGIELLIPFLEFTWKAYSKIKVFDWTNQTLSLWPEHLRRTID